MINLNFKFAVLLMACGAMLTGCDDKTGNTDEPWEPDTPTETPPYSAAPDFDTEIKPFDPSSRATDSYTPGTDKDIYWEANDFIDTLKVTYDGNTANVLSTNEKVIIDISAAHVTIDMATNTVKNVIIVASGTSTDGSLKIYGENKFMLMLDNLQLESKRGPAINSQNKKRMFLNLSKGSINQLADASAYVDDTYYISGADASTEDRKGALFSEGNVIVSGYGLLEIQGNTAHGLATDGVLNILPGTTLAITTSTRNCIHAKGSSKTMEGVTIDGGYIYLSATGDAAKCIKSDNNIVINGGTLSINNSSKAIFDTTDADTSSGAGIKSDLNIGIYGGETTIKTTGDGAKGISAEMEIAIRGGVVTVTSLGKRFDYAADIHSSPSGIKAESHITLLGGKVSVGMFGDDINSEAFDTADELRIGSGEIYAYAYGIALSGKLNIQMVGGYVYAFSELTEAAASTFIDFRGGYFMAYSNATESSGSITPTLRANGATAVIAGGKLPEAFDSSKSEANAILLSSVTLDAPAVVGFLSASNSPYFSVEIPLNLKASAVLATSQSFTAAHDITVTTGGSLPANATKWNGFADKAAASSPTSAKTISVTNGVTII